jgi:hypothetical protein
VCVKWAGSPAQQPAFTNRRIRPLYFAQKLRGNRSQDLRQRRHAGFFRELLERGGRVVDALRGTEPKQTPLAKTLSFDPGEKINPDRIPSPITTSKGPSLPVRNGATISTGGTNAPPAGGLHSGLVLPAIRKGLREFGNDIVGPPTPPDSSQPVTPPSSTAIAHPQATITSPLRTGPRIEINAPRPEAQPNTGPQATPKLKPSQDAEYRGMLLQRRFKTDPGDASLYPGSKRGVPMEASFQSNARGQTAPVSVRSIPASQVGKFAASQGWTPEEAITHLKLAGFLIPQK